MTTLPQPVALWMWSFPDGPSDKNRSLSVTADQATFTVPDPIQTLIPFAFLLQLQDLAFKISAPGF